MALWLRIRPIRSIIAAITPESSASSGPAPSSRVIAPAMPPHAAVATQRGYGCGAEVARSSSAVASSAVISPAVIFRTRLSTVDSRV